MVVSVFCIPVMLFTKPAVLFYENHKRILRGVPLNNMGDSSHLSVNGEDSDHKMNNGHSSNVIVLEEETHEKVI